MESSKFQRRVKDIINASALLSEQTDFQTLQNYISDLNQICEELKDQISQNKIVQAGIRGSLEPQEDAPETLLDIASRQLDFLNLVASSRLLPLRRDIERDIGSRANPTFVQLNDLITDEDVEGILGHIGEIAATKPDNVSEALNLSLHHAAEHPPSFEALLSHPELFDPDYVSVRGVRVLHLLARRGFAKTIRYFINTYRTQCDVNSVNCFGQSPLHVASAAGHKITASVLLEAGANVDLVDRRGDTPIALAAREGQVDVIELLLDSQAARAQARGGSGTDSPAKVEPSHFEANHKQLQNLRVLTKLNNGNGGSARGGGEYEGGQSVSYEQHKGLHHAIIKAHVAAALCLIEKRGDIYLKVRDSKGNTPLHTASTHPGATIVTALMKKNPMLVLEKNNQSRTPLHLACEYRHAEVVAVLIDMCPLDCRPQLLSSKDVIKGYTALHDAAYQGLLSSCELMVRCGASKEATESRGLYPHEVALYRGQLHLHTLLQPPSPYTSMELPGSLPTIFSPPSSVSHTETCTATFIMSTYEPLKEGETVVLVGEAKILGGWDVSNGLALAPLSAAAVGEDDEAFFRRSSAPFPPVLPGSAAATAKGESSSLFTPLQFATPVAGTSTPLYMEKGDKRKKGQGHVERCLNNLWTVTVEGLKSNREYGYRYAVVSEKSGHLRRWESLPGPRVLYTDSVAPRVVGDILGYEFNNKPVQDQIRFLDESYLVGTAQMRVIFSRSSLQLLDPLVQVDRVLVHVGCDNVSPRTLAWPFDSEMKTLNFTTPNLKEVQTLRVDCLVRESDTGGHGSFVYGRAFASHAQLAHGCGALVLPLVDSTLTCVGEVHLRYVVITPFTHPELTLDTPSSAVASWHSSKLIGHRGAGAHRAAKSGAFSYNHIRENTLLSMIHAGLTGAEMVELDVQLTRDDIPVIYHDFFIHIPNTPLKVALSTLTLKEFQSFDKFMQKVGGRPEAEEEEEEDDLDEQLLRSPPVDPNYLLLDDFERNTRLHTPSSPFTTPTPAYSPTITPQSRDTTQLSATELRDVAAVQGTVDPKPIKNRIRRKSLEGVGTTHSLSLGALGRAKQYPHDTRTARKPPPEYIDDRLPSLKEVLTRVPLTTAFDIELKYPVDLDLKEGAVAPDPNHYVDTVLTYVMDYANDRQIVFSTFHPDIAILARLKQPRFPVFFLTVSGTDNAVWADRHVVPDPRTTSLHAALHFCRTVPLMGIVSHSRPIVLAPRLVNHVKRTALLLITYGEDNNNPTSVNLQRRAGVDGIITDHVGKVSRHLDPQSDRVHISVRNEERDRILALGVGESEWE